MSELNAETVWLSPLGLLLSVYFAVPDIAQQRFDIFWGFDLVKLLIIKAALKVKMPTTKFLLTISKLSPNQH